MDQIEGQHPTLDPRPGARPQAITEQLNSSLPGIHGRRNRHDYVMALRLPGELSDELDTAETPVQHGPVAARTSVDAAAGAGINRRQRFASGTQIVLRGTTEHQGDA